MSDADKPLNKKDQKRLDEKGDEVNEKDYVLFFKVGGFSNSGKIFVLIVLLLVQYSTFIWEMSLRHFWCSIGVTRSSTFESSFQLLFSNMNIKVRSAW